jgi:bifunctional enzyme CysN/CysC
MRMPVQSVQLLDGDLCLYAGSLVSGSVRPGDLIRAQPSGQEARVREIVVFQGQLEQAVTGQAVALRLEPALEIARGAVIAAANRPLEVADQFQVDLIWCADEPLLPGRSYLLKTGNQTLDASITEIKHQIDPLTLDTRPAKILARYAIGRCNLQLDREIPFAPYGENRQLGGFQLLERQSQATLACGMIRFALRRASNIHLQAMSLDRAARARMKGQSPRVLWFTGLSGSGKSTIANVLEQQLHAQGYHTYLLDGDNVRHGLNKDLGFTDADRVENIRRIGEVARLMVDAGLIVITAFISPFRAERDMVRALFAAGEFVEIFVDTPLQLAEARDPKGLYHKARSGQLKNFTGIDSAYEIPETPELRLETTLASPLENTGHIIEWLRTHP